jgi:hypothetical protein
MSKKIILILFSLVLVLSMAGSAAAKKPAPTYCVLFWMDGNYDFQFFLVEGKTTWNEAAQVYNATCRYTFDFDSGEWVDLATMCAIFPDYCNPSHTMLTVTAWGWESEYGYTEDTIYQIGQNGKARYFAQLAPGQCTNEYTSSSYTYLPLEEWTPGSHSYYFIETGPDGTIEHDPIEFMVDENAPLLDSNVRLGAVNLRSAEGILDPSLINPEQETYVQLTWMATRDYATYLHDNYSIQLVIDDGEPILLMAGPVVNNCSSFNDGAFQRDWGYVR